MKTYLISFFTLVLSSVLISAEVLEKWEFSEEDGAGLSAMLSNLGTPLSNKDKPSAQVRNGRLEFTGEGEEDSIFLTHEFAQENPNAGIYEAKWTFTSAAFPYTHELRAKGFAGIDLRDTGETIYKGNDDTVIAGVRIGYNKSAIEVQYQDNEGRVYEQIAKVERVVLPEPLHVRILLDYDRAGEPGSMQIFLQLGEEPEINPVPDGVLPEGQELKGYRIMQQITNGGSNWQKGDFVTVDDFSLSRVTAE